jgi:deoxyadenosine/deoxycytidine kinase
MNKWNKWVFSVEGNIGSGKSTLVEYLKQQNGLNGYNVVYVQEPVDVWNTIVDSSGKNIIELYYSNQKRYAFSFQMMAYITRLTQLKKIIKQSPDFSIIITERCLYTDYNIFAKMLYDSGLIEEIEYSIYCKWFNEFIDIDVSGFIYVKTTPETCLKRINLRNRKGEEISYEYLLNCHNYHERWLENTKKLVIDGEPEQSIELVQKIFSFITNSLEY